MFTILWCYLRNPAFKKFGKDYHVAADLSRAANHLGVSIEADIIKQKLPENNGGFSALNYSKSDQRMYTELTSEHPIDLCRYQVANCYMGRIGLINSGGESHGESDLKEAVITAVVNKRAGGMGLFQAEKPSKNQWLKEFNYYMPYRMSIWIPILNWHLNIRNGQIFNL